MTASLAVSVEGLRKRFRDREVVRGVDLAVPEGTVLGLLGPNGAGKTTTIRILATLLAADAGRALVAGFDVERQPREVRRRIGLTGQYAAVDELLSGRNNLRLVGRLLHLGERRAAQRADELLEEFSLTDAADAPASTYSGGMRRRLDLAASLVARPSVLFVDEPTTGLDPTSRRTLWRAIRALVDDGVTVVLTTQYLEEADELADTIVIIDDGRMVGQGTPHELKTLVGGERVVVTAVDESACRRAAGVLGALGLGAPVVDLRGATVTLEVPDALQALKTVTAELLEHKVPVQGVALRAPSLDEVFWHLTSSELPTASAPSTE